MTERKISAKELVADIQSGLDDPALMKKYGLSAQGLQSVFKKLVEAKALKQSELDNRAPFAKKTVDIVWKCPACGKPQTREFDECPECGIIVSKLKDASAKAASDFENLHQDQIGGTPSFFNAHRGEMILVLCGLVLVVIIGAGYLMKAEAERKRQVEAVRIERFETQQRLKADVDRIASELGMLEKIRTAEATMGKDAYYKDTFGIDITKADQVSGLIEKNRQEIGAHQRYVREQDKISYAQARANAAASTDSKILQAQKMMQIDATYSSIRIDRINQEWNQNVARMQFEKELQEASFASRRAAVAEQAAQEERTKQQVRIAYANIAGVTRDMHASMLGGDIRASLPVLKAKIGEFQDAILSLRATPGVNAEVVGHFERAFQHLLAALGASSERDIYYSVQLWNAELSDAYKLMKASD